MRVWPIFTLGTLAAGALAFWAQSFAAGCFLFFLWLAIVNLVASIAAEQ